MQALEDRLRLLAAFLSDYTARHVSGRLGLEGGAAAGGVVWQGLYGAAVDGTAVKRRRMEEAMTQEAGK